MGHLRHLINSALPIYPFIFLDSNIKESGERSDPRLLLSASKLTWAEQYESERKTNSAWILILM